MTEKNLMLPASYTKCSIIVFRFFFQLFYKNKEYSDIHYAVSFEGEKPLTSIHLDLVICQGIFTILTYHICCFVY